MTYVVSEKYVNVRIDKALSEIFNISRNKLLTHAEIYVNDNKVKMSYKLALNDKVDFEIKEVSYNLEAKDIYIEIIYEDEYLAIINKPYNMVIHPCDSYIGDTLINAIKYRIKKLSDLDPLRPGIVHRIDKNTSGLLIIAKTNEAHEKLVKMFKNHEIHKTYLAILKGKFTHKKRVESYIGRSERNRKIFSSNCKNGKLAISTFYPLVTTDKYSLVKVNIETGRTHQIRVHAKELGHPILGDHVYGRNDKCERQQLHSYKLEFVHPFLNIKQEFIAKIPKDMEENIEKLKLNNS